MASTIPSVPRLCGGDSWIAGAVATALVDRRHALPWSLEIVAWSSPPVAPFPQSRARANFISWSSLSSLLPRSLRTLVRSDSNAGQLWLSGPEASLTGWSALLHRNWGMTHPLPGRHFVVLRLLTRLVRCVHSPGEVCCADYRGL